MQLENYWERFENSGKIADYLSYKGLNQNNSRRSEGIAGCKYDNWEGSGYAGSHRSDGDNFKTITHG